MSNTKAIEQFLRTAYTNEKLAALLAWTEDGGLAYFSCCCFTGCATHKVGKFLTKSEWSDIASQDASEHSDANWDEKTNDTHLSAARELPGSDEAESEFFRLGRDDAERRAKLIPLIKFEFARREAMRNTSPQPESGFPSTTVERPSQAYEKVLV